MRGATFLLVAKTLQLQARKEVGLGFVQIFLGSVRSGRVGGKERRIIFGWFCSSCVYAFRAWRRRVVCRFEFSFLLLQRLDCWGNRKGSTAVAILLVLFDFFVISHGVRVSLDQDWWLQNR